MYHPFPEDISLDQEHINSTGVDTQNTPICLTFRIVFCQQQKVLSNLSNTTAQASVSRTAPTL